MMRLILFAAIFFSTVSCAQTHERAKNQRELASAESDTNLVQQKNQLAKEFSGKKIEYFIINVPNDQFGYYVMVDGSMYIEQKTIPAIEGNHGFKTKEDAEKIAQLVIQKIREGELPPTITVEDLIAHHVIDP